MARINRITPVLFVDAIEPSLAFWSALGFEKTVEVPEGDRLGFVILAKDGIEVMYETRAALAKDMEQLAYAPSASNLYVEVDDLEAVVAAVADAPIVVPRRKTFYGAYEVVVREPAGNLVTFAAF